MTTDNQTVNRKGCSHMDKCSFFRSLQKNNSNKESSFVESIAEFMTNFATRFMSPMWIEAIDFTKFHISGGCIVNSLCKQPFPDTALEQVDINFNGNSFSEFEGAVANVFSNLTSILSKNDHRLRATLIKKSSSIYTAILPFDIKLRFNFKDVPEKTNPVSKSSNPEKRSSTEDLNVQAKKKKIETPMLEQKVPMASDRNTTPPKFVSAATMRVPIPEITDEELLAFTLEFERKHGF
ncbi:unnamed protein product [Rotaria sordida]|uniref:Uncharacterized protein n=1 Tax=Rotaria sordida TaxID=392033 RepID=A0A815IJX1_9BILA|nr:unnamed protein product [Rotaria sordida]CAF1608413.1 unnamed protein product [Rotaria sordida]